jgi:hypothetical protein
VVDPDADDNGRPPFNFDGFDLRLISWGDGTGVPTSGNHRVLVGTDNNNVLHVRVFDQGGNWVTDTDETKLPPAQAQAISALKQQLPVLLPSHVLTDAEKARVLGEVTSIIGQTHFDDTGSVSPDDDDFDPFLAEHEQRVRVLATALERYIDLMGVRLEVGDATAKVHASLIGPIVDLRRLIRVAALDLADALTDLELRFEPEYDPDSDDPQPPAYLAFLWLKSLSYSVGRQKSFDKRGLVRVSVTA